MMKTILGILAGALVIVLASGCTTAPDETEDSASAARSSSVDAPADFPLSEVNPPMVPYEEYRLPESICIQDYDTQFAVGGDTWVNQGLGTVVLLDMDTAISATVVPEPQTDTGGYSIITSRCSDRWIAWEEYAGSEQFDPWHVMWKLYAAPIEGEGVAIGQPQLIAESTTSIHSRPLFQVNGDRLYYMTNSAPNPEQEGAVRGSQIKECVLPTGEQREVFSSALNTHTFCAQADELLVSLYVDDRSAAEQVRIVGLADSETRFTADLSNASAEVSHWPAYLDGTLVWGELYSPNVWIPRLRMLTADGRRFALAEAGSNPCFVGSRLVYETSLLHGPASVPWPTINVLNVSTGERYELLSTPGSAELVGLRLFPAQPPAESVLVVSGTVFGGETVAGSGTWVRRYRF